MGRKVSDFLFINTGYIIAHINSDDQHHREALELSQKYEGYPVLTTDAILLEIGHALSRNARQEAATIIHYFQTATEATVIPLTLDLLNSAIEMYKIHQDKTWGLVNCLSFVVMKKQQISIVLAFDRHFVQAGFISAI